MTRLDISPAVLHSPGRILLQEGQEVLELQVVLEQRIQTEPAKLPRNLRPEIRRRSRWSLALLQHNIQNQQQLEYVLTVYNTLCVCEFTI